MHTDNEENDREQCGAGMLYEELSYEIRAAAFEVSNTLGTGFLEKVYENALVHELQLRGLSCAQQQPIRVLYKQETVGDYVADIIVERKVLLELKVVETITNIHRAQVLNYLKATGLQLGMLLNFHCPKLQIERLVLTACDRPAKENRTK